MPISEDEYDHHLDHHPGQQQHAMSKAEQRRSNKPIMEKRRRARINHCLNELKSLILDAMKKDPARHSKLEKADILEMTVKHLQSVQRQQLAVAVATDPAVLHKFKTGFNECAGEVSRYIGRLDGVEPAVKQRLVSHLAHCVSGLQQLTPLAFATAGQPPAPAQPPSQQQQQQPPSAPGDVNNNRGAAGPPAPPQGLQLIPSRLPSGEFALLLPGGGNLQGLPFFPPPPPASAAATLIDRSHPSAFTAVDRPRRPASPPPPLPPAFPQHGPPSPASSISSGDDCSLASEPYLSSSSPPPPSLAVTTAPTTVPAPIVTTSSIFHPPVSMPPAIPSVTTGLAPPMSLAPPTTSVAPTSETAPVRRTPTTTSVGTVTEVKLEFKTIPVHSAAMLPVTATTCSPKAAVVALTTAPPATLHQPLSGITTPLVYKPPVPTPPGPAPLPPAYVPAKDPPLDFSIKKEEPPQLQTTSTQTPTPASLGLKRPFSIDFVNPEATENSAPVFAPPGKMARFSLHVKTEVEPTMLHPAPRPLEPSALLGGSLLKIAGHNPPTLPFAMGEDLTNKPPLVSRVDMATQVNHVPQPASTSGNDTEHTASNTAASTSASAAANAAAAAANKDMWRPW